jgi:DNA-binding transcriptional LysR family regulator
MDWRSVTFDWNRARAFLVTAEEGSFSAAARALGATQPTVGRQVGALERELGVTLFERVGTGLELTGAGLELVDHIRAMAEAATRVSLTATGKSSSVVGAVCITASEVIAAHMLPSIVHQLRIDHPGIEIEIVASNEARDLHRREADIAIRNFRPTQADLLARKLRDSRAHMYAAPSCLKRLGRVRTVKDLEAAGAEIFAFDRTEVMIRGLRNLGFEATTKNFPIVTSNHLVQWELCKAGAGICFMMEEVGDAEPSVRRVLPKMPPLPVPIWLVCHRELQTSRRIRLVFDRIADALASPARR